mgnify:CR=1 FL=1
MEKKFKILRVIGTIWKVLAWIALILGLLFSVGVLLMSIFGGGMMRQLVPQQEQMPWGPVLFGVVGGVVTFIILLIGTAIDFLMLYAVGEFIYLVLAIEENTRRAAQWIESQVEPAPTLVAPPSAPTTAPSPPPPPIPTPPPPQSG